ncbi:MAG: 6-carboxytetrahydropterin synthase [bacterium]|nr:6-carboxytetrahydropterin synthase [bacterium]
MTDGAERFLLTVSAVFDAAHRIRDAGGRCERLHGHSWRLEATFGGDLGPSGMVRDFLDLEREMERRVVATLDHSDLNDIFENPTTELICRWIWERLAPLGVVEVRLWETPSFSVTCRGGGGG